MVNQSKKIASVPLIKDLSPVLQDAVVQILDSISEELMLNKGETLYHEGEEGDNTGVLLISGSVEISHGNTDPKIVKAPELFGEMRQMNDKGQRV
ncbi:MAG: cyclic nucleotide-binding domain-containing protein, partial [Candidatus Hydrogenedentota bacterium]